MYRTISGVALREPLARFLLVTFALGTALQLAAVAVGLKTGPGSLLLLATMWAPAVGVVAAGGEARRRAFAAARRSGWRWLPAGFLVGLGPQLLQKGLLVLSGTAVWDSKHVELAADGRSVAALHGLGMVLGVGPQGLGFFALNLLVTILIASVMTGAVGGFGEELGWRGLLQPELEARHGVVRGTVLTGLVWAYWHLPANLAGFNDAQHPVVGSLAVFPLLVVGLAVGLAWLTRRSGSVWPAALAHGANNTIGAGLLVNPSGWSADTVTGLVATLLVVALVVALERRWPGRATPPRGQAVAAPVPLAPKPAV